MAVALIVAAGRGERLGAEAPKAFATLAGRPMVAWSIEALRGVPAIERIVVAVPPGYEAADAGSPALRDALGDATRVAGGAARSQSVARALAAAGAGPPDEPIVVHDAARPLVDAALVQRSLDALAAHGCDAVVAAARVTDTVKAADADGRVEGTLDRARLWAVQTPQVFRRGALETALSRGDDALAAATDDASLIEEAGGAVRVVESQRENLKVTTPIDLRVAELLLAARRNGEPSPD